MNKKLILLLSHPEICKSYVTGSYIPYLFEDKSIDKHNKLCYSNNVRNK